MQEPQKAVLDATYDAVVVLLRLTDNTTFPFCVGVMDEVRWAQRNDASERGSVSRALNADCQQLVRCATESARSVYQRVLKIATSPAFNGRCRNADDDPSAIDPASPRAVIYLCRAVEPRTGAVSSETADMAESNTVSGMHPRFSAVRSA